VFACSPKKTEETKTTQVDTVVKAAAPTLTKVWETDSVLTTVESTLFDKSANIIYTSNISGDPTKKDKNGFISKLSPDGKVLQLKWVSGLNAPKGSTIMNGKFYVTDIDELVEINIADSTVKKKYKVPGAVFLNDAANDGKNVYFSDYKTGKVHVLKDGKVSTLVSGKEGANGVAVNNKGELFLLDSKGLRKFGVSDTTSTFINEVVTGGDGLVIIDDSTYIASRWQGEIYLIKNGKETLLLDTKAQSSNTADIDYIADQKLVLVPTFMKNKVAAYKLEY
ncbi:MAG: ATP-binding protein, partial [Cytophagaceae bacterium]